jgi:endonuclease G
VSWNVNKHDIGETDREARFHPDPELPSTFYHVQHNDYNSSGFDRGHMCPSKDRSDNHDNNKVTFNTTNIVPQSPKCNQRCWKKFEDDCRRMTRDGSELYIVAGPYGEGGEGLEGEKKTIGKTQSITVPAAVWKVVMVLPNKDAMPTQSTRTFAVWMPNDQKVSDNWKPYAVSIAEVEKRTGYKFFPVVPDDIANTIKAHIDR